MEIIPGEEEIKKLSQFLSENHIAHYVHEFSLHIPGEITYVSFDDPFEIRVEQNNGEVVRIAKEDDKYQVETWKGLESVIYNIRLSGVEVVYHDGELEIRFIY